MNCAPVRDSDTDVVGVAEVVLDITERKQAEREQRKLVDALRAEREVFDVVHRVGQQLASELNVGRLAQALADAAAQLSSAELSVFVYASPGLYGGRPGATQARSETCSRTHARSACWLLLRPHLGPCAARDFALWTTPDSPRSSIKRCDRPRTSRAGSVIPNQTAERGHQCGARRGPSNGSRVLGAGKSALGSFITPPSRWRTRATMGKPKGSSKTLAESNRELDQFAYVTSHDLKAPLRGIANIANWLEEDLGDALPRRWRTSRCSCATACPAWRR